MNIMNAKGEVEYWPENNPITLEELNEIMQDVRENWKAVEDANKILNETNFDNTTGTVDAENESQLHSNGLQGWVCPVCGRALAPWVAICNHGEAQKMEITCYTSTSPEYLKNNDTSTVD